MLKTFTDLTRHALNGATMGTRWSALLHLPANFDVTPARTAMVKAVAEVDQQMSTWKSDSDLNRLNNAKPGEWVTLPVQLLTVLGAGLSIGQASGGAFDIGMGDAISAWGFGPQELNEERIKAARLVRRSPAHDMLELDRANGRAKKHAPMRFDLNGIAKGYGVDRLMQVACEHGIDAGLFAIDGELRALGTQPDGGGWTIAIEAPDLQQRSAHSILDLQDAAIATSGDYRHWIDIGHRRLSHTMDPRLGMPLGKSPASVTVVASDCMSADAWATAMMVMGAEKGLLLAEKLGLSALFLSQDDQKARGGGLFAKA
ncbi:FAD:protein FMN transferase [Rhizobium sp.]|jgi:FAD:protein FMN transferase|uniref:FAD:protein FMN transferase n=1 Tax=Rhizobium sp. TaxID=391 RepID=UPI000E9DFC6D|nr:thiamine biosynthesis protein ApbE [Rhizobium sp.]